MENMDKIQISGSIGLIKIKNEKMNKNVYMFFDDHSNKKYCKMVQSTFITDLFNSLIQNQSDSLIQNQSNYMILLEEPFINKYSKIKFLWTDSPHIDKFRTYYKNVMNKCSKYNVCYTFPIDIRLLLFDVSLDELIANMNNDSYFIDYDITTEDYFKYLLYIFDDLQDSDLDLTKCDNNIIFIKKVFKIYVDSKYYKKLKSHFNDIKEKFINNNLKKKIKEFIKIYGVNHYLFSVGYPFINSNSDNFIDQYDKLINGLMEFYMCILIFGMDKKNIIIHTGYYHANNLIYILTNYYSFIETYRIGNVSDIENKNTNDVENCLFVDKKIFID